jgi:hypothetical protein
MSTRYNERREYGREDVFREVERHQKERVSELFDRLKIERIGQNE